MYSEYNTIENHKYIPKEAFLYFPNGDTKKRQEDDYKYILPKGQVKRLIYEGHIQYLDEQNQLIDQFILYLHQKNIQIGQQWSRPYIYKFLQSTGYDYKRTIKQILAHNDYKKQLHSKKFEDIAKIAQPILSKGTFYFNGRDAKYRPILVVDIKKIHELKLSETDVFATLQYFFEFMYRNMFINGQAENVIGIIDVGNISPFDLIQPMKMTIGFLQGNYKYKLHVIYILRSTSMFKFAYSIAKQFMKQDTIRKINVLNGDTVQPLLQFCNSSQLEKRFGGDHYDLRQGQFWPPFQFSNDYSHPKVKRNFITPQQYKDKYNRGELPSRKIWIDYIRDQNSKQQIPTLNNSRVQTEVIEKPERKQKKKKNKGVCMRVLQSIGCTSCCVSGYENRKIRQK